MLVCKLLCYLLYDNQLRLKEPQNKESFLTWNDADAKIAKQIK